MSYEFQKYDAVYSISAVNGLVAKGWKLISVNNGSDPDTDRPCPIYTLGWSEPDSSVASPGAGMLIGKARLKG